MKHFEEMGSQRNSPIKIVLLGDEGVGKTALLVRFLCRRYLGEYDPTIEDSYSKKITVDGKTSIIEVLDTADKGLGTSRREDFMTTAHAFIIVFSTTNRKTFESVTKYKNTIDEHRGQCLVPIGLIGTKSDLTHLRQVKRNDAQAVASGYEWSYSECSAAYDLNIQSIFHNIVRRIRGDTEVDLVKKNEHKTVSRKKSIFNKISSQFQRKRSYSKNSQIPKESKECPTHLFRTRLFSSGTDVSPPSSIGRRRSYSVTTLI